MVELSRIVYMNKVYPNSMNCPNLLEYVADTQADLFTL